MKQDIELLHCNIRLTCLAFSRRHCHTGSHFPATDSDQDPHLAADEDPHQPADQDPYQPTDKRADQDTYRGEAKALGGLECDSSWKNCWAGKRKPNGWE